MCAYVNDLYDVENSVCVRERESDPFLLPFRGHTQTIEVVFVLTHREDLQREREKVREMV